MTPVWLARTQVERIHEKVIEAAGGASGIRDRGLLESALARPQNLHAYGEHDLFQLAASYAEGIARNHPFVDGNKRTAFQSADWFLFTNGQALQAREDDVYVDMMVDLAQGKINREVAAVHLRENSADLNR